VLRLTWKNLRANLTRLLATAVAIVTGTAFVAAALMLTTAIGDAVEGNVDQQYAGVDVTVEAPQGDSSLWSSVPTETLEEVRALPGVTAAAGEIVQSVQLLDESNEPVRSRSLGRVWITDDELNPFDVREGRAPTSPGEVAIDEETARDAGLDLGDPVRLATPSGEMERRLVGVTGFGRSSSVDPGGTISFSEADGLEVLTGGVPGWQQVLVRGDVGEEELAARVRAALSANLEVSTGTEFRQSQVADTQDFLDVLRPVLVGFAYLALFVAGFVIYNTFTVVVSQRSRELALVRAIGGTPAQVRRSLMAEGTVLGVVASVAGLFAGAGLALAIQALLGHFDLPLPGTGVAITPWVVFSTVVAGTVITVISVMLPAFRAGRTKPVEAMRDAEVDRSGTSRFRLVAGASLLVLALVLLGLHRFVLAKWWVLAPGALALFAGIVVGGPLLARLFGRGLRRLLGRTLTAKIAADNLARNPKRTATTANALVVGLFLVSFVTVSGTAVRDWVEGQFRGKSSADFLVMGMSPISDDLVEEIRDTEGVDSAAAVRLATVTSTSGVTGDLAGADLDDLRASAGVEELDGSLDAVAAGEGAAVSDLESLLAETGGGPGDGSRGGGPGGGGPGGDPEGDGTGGQVEISGVTSAQVGDVLSLLDAEGDEVQVPVVATFTPQFDTIFLSTVVDDELFERIAGDQPVMQVYVRADPRQVDAVGGRLDRVLDGYTGLEVLPGNFIGQLMSSIIDFLIGAVNGLLGLSVVIALIGIVNTMNLSIHERRRELGMVRALGMTSSQVRWMVRIEAVLIGVLGTLIGVAAGSLLGAVVIGAIDEVDVPLAWGRVGWIVLAGVVVSVIASLWPARRAVKLPMLDAMAAT
jgi:putative ABC transport system permease protein